EAGLRLQPRLMPGQRLVDREGHLWRWDGLIRMASGPSAAAQLLQHKNRLAVLTKEIATLEVEDRAAERVAQASRAARQQAAEAERAARLQLREAEAAVGRADAAETELAGRALTTETQLTALADTVGKLRIDLAEAQAQAEETERDLALLVDPALARASLDKGRADAAKARREEAEVRAAIERLTRDA